MLNPNNGSASLGGGDVESNNEHTAPLPSSSGTSSPGDDSPGTAESGESDKSGLWQEMDMPWPATFERSISLLASPVIKADEAERFTKSPKPGNTPLAIRRKMVRQQSYISLVSPILSGNTVYSDFLPFFFLIASGK